MIAVSSNEHIIRLFYPIDPLLGPVVGTSQSRVLKGHVHNIPCVDFSPCGRYLVSCSIDGTCRIWNVDSGDIVSDHAIDSLKWNWVSLFIDKNDVKQIQDDSEDPGRKGFNAHVVLGLHAQSSQQRQLRVFPDAQDSDSGGLGEDETPIWSDGQITPGTTTSESLFQMDSEESSWFTASEELSIHSSASFSSRPLRSRRSSGSQTDSDFVQARSREPSTVEEGLDYLVLRTTADDIYLMDATSTTLLCVASLPQALAGWEEEYAYRGLNRLCIVEWVSELSAAIVVSQMGKAAIVRILK